MTRLINNSPRQLTKEISVGPLGYGCWRLINMSVSDARARIETALDNGMNLIDTADVYGLDWGGTAFGSGEELLGQVLADAPTLRDQMVLVSKGGIIPGVPYDSAYLEAACEASLKRLCVDQLDLYLIHRPDMLTHPEETARVLQNLKQSGKVKALGVSNYLPSQTAALMHYLPGEIICQQTEFSALHIDPLFDGTFDQCMQHKQLVLAWSPLAGGKLAGQKDIPEELATVLQSLAEREGVDLATISLAFVLAHPSNPVALVGSIDLNRIAEAKKAIDVSLDRKDVYQIIEASMGDALP